MTKLKEQFKINTDVIQIQNIVSKITASVNVIVHNKTKIS